mmetsp:Transcript_135362/g.350758  ORF Transcript_135362/g.350758 Transcript_135362/m.350758 type:complete len:575 (-) Transcript_135362:62-1786(-)
MRQPTLQLPSAVVAAAVAATCFWWQPAAAFTCASDTSLGSTAFAAKKGIAVDDSTMKWCTSQIPEVWPNSNAAMTSIRLFKAWDATWEADQAAAWDNLAAYVTNAGAQVLIGTQITCDEAEDNQAWEWTKALVKKLHPDHVMGLGIGNELELLQYKGTDMVPESCLKKIWEEGYLWQQFQRMVSEFDDLGFDAVPVTSVFTGLGLSGSPFYEHAGKARVNSFLVNATKAYGDRFAFTWNFYPYFDPNYGLDAGTSDECTNALNHAACWGPECSVPVQMRMARAKMAELATQTNAAGGGKLWIGETGWSSDLAETLKTNLKPCTTWSSMDTFRNYYRDFLAWDLDIGGNQQAPDHVFWFTMRDSHNFGANEFFGLISECDEPKCKVISDGYEAADYTEFDGPAARSCGDAPLYNSWSRGEENCKNKCTLDPHCKYFGIWPHSHNGHYWCKLTSTCTTWTSDSHQVSTHKKGPASSPEPIASTPSPNEPEPTPAPSPAPTPMPVPAPTPATSAPTPSPSDGSGDDPQGVKDPGSSTDKEIPTGDQDMPVGAASRPLAHTALLLAWAVAAPLVYNTQ